MDGLSSLRYAPSPTGVLHIGNLRTAWISWYLAQKLKYKWVLRFEDIDSPRVVKGAINQQLADFKTLGMQTDRIQIQSEFCLRHQDLFLKFWLLGLVYPCFCSRKEVQTELSDMAAAPHGKPVEYSGRCRDLKEIPEDFDRDDVVWRFKNTHAQDDFGLARTRAPKKLGEPPPLEHFHPSYQWACSVDDFMDNHQMIVRGYDLESSLPKQRLIWDVLSQIHSRQYAPKVFHCTMVTDKDGNRLEKRSKGVTLKELFAQGYTAEKILEVFEKSFDSSVTSSEMLTQMRITELLELV